MKENIVKNKSFAFAVRVMKLYQFLCKQKKEICNLKATIKKWNKCWGYGKRSGTC